MNNLQKERVSIFDKQHELRVKIDNKGKEVLEKKSEYYDLKLQLDAIEFWGHGM